MSFQEQRTTTTSCAPTAWTPALPDPALQAGRDSKKQRTTQNEPTPAKQVVLVTDIGRDIDDTIALKCILNLHRQNKIVLRGVVATGGAGFQRACIVRWWIRSFGLSDEEVFVAADMSTGKDACYMPAAAKAPGVQLSTAAGAGFGLPLANLHNAQLYSISLKRGVEPSRRLDAGGWMIAKAAQKYGKALHLAVIGPCSPVAKAVTLDTRAMRRIGQLLIQGQCHVSEARDYFGGCHIEPDFGAFNLREDQAAARTCFDALQQHVPFRFLGKHAAYRVSLNKSDFAQIDSLLARSEDPLVAARGRDSWMTLLAKHNLNIFRVGNPELFYRVYSVPKHHQNDESWFDGLHECCHPYDPLLCLTLEHCHDLIEQEAGWHRCIGMTPEQHGVPNVSAVHDRLQAHLVEATAHICDVANRRCSSVFAKTRPAKSPWETSPRSRRYSSFNVCLPPSTGSPTMPRVQHSPRAST